MPELAQEFVHLPVDALEPHPENPRRGDTEAIADSIRHNGFYGAIIAQRVNGGPHRIIAGEHRWKAAQVDGLAEVPVLVVDADDEHALRIMLADNRTQDIAGYDTASLMTLLADIGDMTGTGYDTEALASLADEMNTAAAKDSLDTAGAPGKRTLPLDLIFSCSNPVLLKLAVMCGWRAGCISEQITEGWVERLERMNLSVDLVDFVDNEFKDYNHEKHLAGVALARPKYATVRDIMSRDQCRAAGIDYYPLEKVLDLAQEVKAAGAEQVIIIPKWDCLDQIPEEYVIGYSLPSSYGMTPLTPEVLKGRRIHLLGSSWKTQRAALAVLADDVVSLDNNHFMRVAKFGAAYRPDGSSAKVSEMLGFEPPFPLMTALAVSASAVAAAVTELCGPGTLSAPMEPEPDPPRETRGD